MRSGRVNFSHPRGSGPAYRCGSRHAGRIGGPCGGRRAGTACSRSTFPDQMRSQSSRMRFAACAPDATTRSISSWRFPLALRPTPGRPRAQPGSSLASGHSHDGPECASRFDGAPDLEFRLATKALELEQSGLGYQRVPPGYRFPYGHTHRRQEEVYVVLRGSGRMKLDDEIVELEEWDAVRVPPGTWRGYEAGSEGLEIIVIGAPSLGDARREDVEGRREWWPE